MQARVDSDAEPHDTAAEFHIGRRFPLRRVQRATVVDNLAMLGVSAALAVGGIVAVVQLLATDASELPRLVTVPIFAFMALAGLLLAGVSLASLRHRLNVRIDPDRVRGARRTLRGTTRWNDPIVAYSGLLTEESASGREHSDERVRYTTTLKHRDDSNRDVCLHQTLNRNGHRAEAEAFARMLQLPLLVQRPDGGYFERAVEDLDKSAVELIAEGSLAAPGPATVDPRRPPPGDAISIRKDGAVTVFELSSRRYGQLLLGLVLEALALGPLAWLLTRDAPLTDGAGLIGLAVTSALVIFGGVFTLTRLYGVSTVRVGPTELTACTELAGRRYGTRVLVLDEIEEIEIRRRPHNATGLVIASDRDEVSIGEHLSQAEREYLRGSLLHLLGDAEARGDVHGV